MSNICIAVKTAEDKLEPTAQANSVATAMKLAVLEKLAMQNFALNDEIWITESGEWEVPYDGTYEILAIDGGNGAYVNASTKFAGGGTSGAYKLKLAALKKGTVLPIAIGAGGLGTTTDEYSITVGGVTTVGNIDFSAYSATSMYSVAMQNVTQLRCSGAGFGGGAFQHDGRWWGAGGGGGQAASGVWEAHNGKQGAVRFRFFNPTKASLPTINDTDLIPYIELLNRLEAIEAQLNINS